MAIHLKIKNYRGFSREQPLEITLANEVVGFTGVNNSGKSTILKFFVELRPIFHQIAVGSEEFRTALNKRQEFKPKYVYDNQEIFNDFNDGPIEIEMTVDIAQSLIDENTGGPPYADKLLITIDKGTTSWGADVALDNGPWLDTQGKNGRLNPQGWLEFGGQHQALLSQIVAAADKIQRALYIGPFRNAINIGHNEDYLDIQVGEAFIKQWRAYKTGGEKVQQRAIFKLEQEITRIFGFSTLSIDAASDDRTLQLYIDGDPYKLHEVGSGLTQFILVFANALIKNPSYILIDEPELGLHPSLQLDFLTSLATYANEGLLFTTHSIGLGRAANDKLFSVIVEKKTRKVKRYEATDNLVELLGEMSYSGYRELGFDKILLVEGPTEIKLIQQFLKHYKLDHKLVLLSLGGHSMINGRRDAELAELTRLSPKNIFCLIDSEKTSKTDTLSKSRQEFVAVCKKLKIDCYVLERRATENYLTTAAIQTVKGDKYSQLGEFEKLEDANPCWGKNENWKIGSEMKKSEIEKTDLGKFIAKIAKSK